MKEKTDEVRKHLLYIPRQYQWSNQRNQWSKILHINS